MNGHRQLASGFSSLVYETADGFVCRVARTAGAEERFARECRFLPFLAARLPVAIPLPVQSATTCMVYKKLPGEPLQPGMLELLDGGKLAAGIANFMHALHSVSVPEALRWGVSGSSRTRELLAAADRVLPLIPEPMQTAARSWREQFVELDHPQVVIHGDLWHENLLIDVETGCLSGVVDFEQTSIGDPAWDIATQLHCGPEFARMVFNAYSLADESLWLRAGTLFRLREFEGLEWAARQGDSAEFEEGLRKLRSAGVLP